MKARAVRISTYNGHKAGSEPVALLEGENWTGVEEILDRWYQGSPRPGPPAAAFFRVRLTDGRRLLLRHIQLFDDWAEILPRPEAMEPSPPPPKLAKVIPFPSRR